MEKYDIRVIETIAIIVVFITTMIFTNSIIKKVLKKYKTEFHRRKIIIKIINAVIVLTAIIFLLAVWGIKQSELLVFLTTITTILGIAFFAQWSILSNITSGLILFFGHPLRIGDEIRLTEKDYEVEGKVVDISLFFIHIKTNTDENITVPNSMALQKNILVKNRDEKKNEKL